MQPSKDGFFNISGYSSGYSALQQDAVRRLSRMEQRARDAVNGGGQTGGQPEDVPTEPDIPAHSAAGLRGDVPKRRAPAAADNGELAEQLFLLLLIYLLAREKSDPCLIAALVYLLL